MLTIYYWICQIKTFWIWTHCFPWVMTVRATLVILNNFSQAKNLFNGSLTRNFFSRILQGLQEECLRLQRWFMFWWFLTFHWFRISVHLYFDWLKMSFLPPDWTIQNLWALLPTRAAWCWTPAHVQLKECLVKTGRDMTVTGSRMHTVEVKGVFVRAERIVEGKGYFKSTH